MGKWGNGLGGGARGKRRGEGAERGERKGEGKGERRRRARREREREIRSVHRLAQTRVGQQRLLLRGANRFGPSLQRCRT